MPRGESAPGVARVGPRHVGAPGRLIIWRPNVNWRQISGLFQWCFSAPYMMAPLAAARLACPLIRPWVCHRVWCIVFKYDLDLGNAVLQYRGNNVRNSVGDLILLVGLQFCGVAVAVFNFRFVFLRSGNSVKWAVQGSVPGRRPRGLFHCF
jgi:hypothetical protein